MSQTLVTKDFVIDLCNFLATAAKLHLPVEQVPEKLFAELLRPHKIEAESQAVIDSFEAYDTLAAIDRYLMVSGEVSGCIVLTLVRLRSAVIHRAINQPRQQGGRLWSRWDPESSKFKVEHDAKHGREPEVSTNHSRGRRNKLDPEKQRRLAAFKRKKKEAGLRS